MPTPGPTCNGGDELKRRLLFDLEGNDLLPGLTKIHCVAAADPDTGERFDWKPHQLSDALETLSKADQLVAHSGIGYDFPALEKIYSFKVPEVKQLDTVVIARLIYPNIGAYDDKFVLKGTLPSRLHSKHTLEAWGYRLGQQKHEYEGGWDEWSETMHSYMVGDVDTLLALWKKLDPDTYSQPAIELEHRIARLARMMEDVGCPFNQKRAQELHFEWLSEQNRLEKELVQEFGFWFEPKEKKRDIDGFAPSFIPKKDDAKRGYVKGHSCTKVEKVTFNPSSRKHIAKVLTGLGWKPTQFTPTGQPQLSDEDLAILATDYPDASKLAKYLLLGKRLGQLAEGDKAWLKMVQPDGRMHGGINPMGTIHGRASHMNPNMGQVPASKSPYGHECRELFTAPDNWVMVGADMAGLQLRALAHYLAPFDNGDYIKTVTTGDVHWAHAQAMNLVEREEKRDTESVLHNLLRDKGAKTFGYAYIFGCFDDKAGSIVRDVCQAAKDLKPEWGYLYEKFFPKGETNRSVGNKIRSAFNKRLKLDGLQQKLRRIMPVKNAAKRKPANSIPGLDGRWVPCRSEHSALNFALSSAEAIICKNWICNSYDEFIRKGWVWGKDFIFMLWVHDEVQIAVPAGRENEAGEILKQQGEKAGEAFGFRCPLESDWKSGRNWAETH